MTPATWPEAGTSEPDRRSAERIGHAQGRVIGGGAAPRESGHAASAARRPADGARSRHVRDAGTSTSTRRSGRPRLRRAVPQRASSSSWDRRGRRAGRAPRAARPRVSSSRRTAAMVVGPRRPSSVAAAPANRPRSCAAVPAERRRPVTGGPDEGRRESDATPSAAPAQHPAVRRAGSARRARPRPRTTTSTSGLPAMPRAR